MAALDYIDIPVGATRLRSLSNAKSHDIRPAPKITTSIPNPSPPPSPTSMKRRPSILSSTAMASPSLSLFPQLVLSASFPPLSPNSGATPPPVPKSDPSHVKLLSSRVPLSLPVMSTNFKRFVSVIGPVFWLQDRVEEIILWKTGPARTLIWMAAYSFICTSYSLPLYNFRLTVQRFFPPRSPLDAPYHSHWYHSRDISISLKGGRRPHLL